MKIKFTYHAQYQALERHIDMSLITDALRNPDSHGEAPGGALFYRKKFESGILEVICRKIGIKQNKYLVMTAYFL